METIASKLLGEYGAIPTIVLIAVILWFFLREVKKEVGGVKSSLGFLKEDILARIKELEIKSDAQDEKISAELAELKMDMKYIEREYVRRDEHYKDLGGWRTEFRYMQDRIDTVQERVDAVLEGMSKWKN